MPLRRWGCSHLLFSVCRLLELADRYALVLTRMVTLRTSLAAFIHPFFQILLPYQHSWRKRNRSSATVESRGRRQPCLFLRGLWRRVFTLCVGKSDDPGFWLAVTVRSCINAQLMLRFRTGRLLHIPLSARLRGGVRPCRPPLALRVSGASACFCPC
jgi:hypothetical protein